MKAVIMAGGEGSRLRPLTCNNPKPMMPLLGKPLMEYTIELLRENGINDIAVTLHYLPDEITNYFKDGKEFGVNISYFIENYPLGTAGSVKNAEHFLDDTFIVISGDSLTDINLAEAIKYHKEKNAEVTIILKEVAVPLEYGVVVSNKQGLITGFLEKPGWGEVFSDKVNTGIYIIKPEVLSYLQNGQQFDFSKDLFPLMLKMRKPIYGFVSQGYWCDIGSIEQYVRCSQDVLKGIVNVRIKGEKRGNGLWVGEDCDISPEAKIIPPVFIDSNCNIYKNAVVGPYSVLGRSNIISDSVVIRRSILFDNCYIGNNSEVKGAVLSHKVKLESKVSVYEECSIGDDTLIREKAIIKPGIKIWPNKEIETSTIVKSNVIWGGKFFKSLFGKIGVTGEVNVDITPEFVSKLGSAYGSLLKPESRVAISCSDNAAAQMFKYSLATGLLSMGVEVYDLKRMTIAMTRQVVSFFGIQGAVHVFLDNNNPHKVNIVFMDEQGLNLDRNVERKLENSFIREDFRRVKTDAFKKIKHMNDCMEYYIRHLINRLDTQSIRVQKYRIVLSITNTMFLSVIEKFFSEFQVNLKLHYEPKNLTSLRQSVMDSGANMGIYISGETSAAIIVDEKGNIIEEELMDALYALILLKTTKLSTLVVPVTASSSTERIASLCGVKFIRSKISQKSIMDNYLKNETRLSRSEITSACLLSFDTVYLIMATINLMAKANLPLSAIISEFPRYYTLKFEVNCPWNMKGRVMRYLIEENNSNSVELIEGVRLKYARGWALVLPDVSEPLCKIYIESEDQKTLMDICEEVKHKIGTITLDPALVKE